MSVRLVDDAQARLPMSRLLELLGLNAEQFTADLGPFLSNMRTGPTGPELLPADVMAAAVANAIAAKPVPDDDVDDDAGDVGDGSPELERWRRARANLAELDLEEKRGKLLPREHVRAGLAAYSSSIRRAGELFQRQFGPDAVAVLDEALRDAEQAAAAVFGQAIEDESVE